MYNLMKNKNIDTDIILNSLQNPIIVINSLKKTIVYCNNETENFLNISKKQIIGKKIDDIFVSDSNFINIINKSISDNRDSLVHNMRIILYKKAIDISVSISKTNVNKLFSIIINDLSKSNKLKNQFSFEKSVQSTTSLISMLSHEIKNPLSGIKGASQLLKKNGSTEKKYVNLINLIESETERVKNLLNSLEDFTDERPVKKTPLNLNEVLRYVKKTMKVSFNERDILFLEEYDPALPLILGNKNLLIQLFSNIVKNSCESINSGGGIIKIKSKYEHGNLPISVYIEDNGKGIPEHLKENIFDAFVTNKTNGKGLGLAISAKIVRSHLGSIEFDSFDGKTIFKTMFNKINHN